MRCANSYRSSLWIVFLVSANDRIAQLILERIVTPAVKEVQELPETERGAGGFGSTGKN